MTLPGEQDPAGADAERVAADLIWVSREAGRPELDLVVLAEGNSSALLTDGTFLCTASGSQLATMAAEELVRLRLDPIVAFLRSGATGGGPEAVELARHGGPGPAPSIETFVHAICLAAAGGGVILHTHPTGLVGILASPDARAIVGSGPVFPDEAVLCGVAPLYVDYFPPGLELGRALDVNLAAYIAEHGEPPRVIHLANHGLVAIGRTAREALAITVMATKAGAVRLAALRAGGIRPLPANAAAALVRRTDERQRRDQVTWGAS